MQGNDCVYNCMTPNIRGVGMKFKLGGADLSVILLNIKMTKEINSSVVKRNKLFSYF